MNSEQIGEKVEDIDDTGTKPVRLTPTGKISHAKTRVYTQRYRKEWENTPDFKDWLTSVPFQATRAFCKFCQRNLHAHRLSLLKHMCTLKHQRAAVQYAKTQEDHNGRGTQDTTNSSHEQIDTDDEEDDDNNYENVTYVHGDDEEDFEEHEEEVIESENDVELPACKKIRIQNDDGQDTLVQAIANAHPDLLDENNEEMQFEMVNETDSVNDIPVKPFHIVKCESLLEDPKSDEIDVNSRSTNKAKESEVIFATELNKTADSTLVDSGIVSNSLHGKKVILLSTGGKSFTVLKGKLPQFLLNQSKSSSTVKREKNELKTTQDSETNSIYTFASTSQELTTKHNYSKTLAMTTKSILMKKPIISTNVIETSKGIPVSGLQIILYKLDDGRWKNIHEGYTSANGTYDFSNSSKNNLSVGRYRLHYDVEKYYSLKKVATVYPFIEIVFDVKDPGATYNIPLLMSPFSYSTFKDFPR
ncbi:uncharacterized protein LOC131672307 [Phymastichus coffea]|uniref:uncharacterized protein LOC131672307 n=1 Tax=Phymastichus coffea TaxID=108790 RepID=UPI00273AD665|nr:uncharacterized protein LOC131672307 [Phymastichus coffea]